METRLEEVKHFIFKMDLSFCSVQTRKASILKLKDFKNKNPRETQGTPAHHDLCLYEPVFKMYVMMLFTSGVEC
jgi:hypothetical protein